MVTANASEAGLSGPGVGVLSPATPSQGLGGAGPYQTCDFTHKFPLRATRDA